MTAPTTKTRPGTADGRRTTTMTLLLATACALALMSADVNAEDKTVVVIDADGDGIAESVVKETDGLPGETVKIGIDEDPDPADQLNANEIGEVDGRMGSGKTSQTAVSGDETEFGADTTAEAAAEFAVTRDTPEAVGPASDAEIGETGRVGSGATSQTATAGDETTFDGEAKTAVDGKAETVGGDDGLVLSDQGAEEHALLVIDTDIAKEPATDAEIGETGRLGSGAPSQTATAGDETEF